MNRHPHILNASVVLLGISFAILAVATLLIGFDFH